MITILASLLPIFALIFLGLALDRAPFIPRPMGACLNQFVYWVGFPAFLFKQMTEIHAEQISLGILGGLGLSAVLAWLLTMFAVRRDDQKTKSERIMFTLLATFPNFAYMGLAIIALLRPGNTQALVVASLSSIIYITLLLFADAKLRLDQLQGRHWAGSLTSVGLSMLKNPMLMAPLIGAAIGLGGLPLPRPVHVFFTMLGNTAAPCALISMGMLLGAQASALRKISPAWLKKQALLHGVKLILTPGLAFLCLALFGVRGIALGVGTIIAATPIGVAAYVVSEKYGLLPEESSLGIVLNTALSIITLPLTILLMETFSFL